MPISGYGGLFAPRCRPNDRHDNNQSTPPGISVQRTTLSTIPRYIVVRLRTINDSDHTLEGNTLSPLSVIRAQLGVVCCVRVRCGLDRELQAHAPGIR